MSAAAVPQGTPPDALAAIVGQDEAVTLLRAELARPVHAFLFVGPRGSGKRAAALAFAAELLAADSDGATAERHRRLALAETHPDLEVVEREGASISRDQARRIVEHAVRSPVEGRLKILLLTEFHLVLDAAPILLKSIEEPPSSTIFVVLADEIPPELVTIASRCLLVRFHPLSTAQLLAALLAEGVEEAAAERAADAAGGDLERARILAADPGLEARAATWRAIPERLDGRGATACALVVELSRQLDEALAPLDERQRAELAELSERMERYGLTRAALKATEDRHKRERRRFRTDELRFGLAVLARACRDHLATRLASPATQAAGVPSPGPASLEPFAAVQAAAESLERNPNETLLLEALLLRLRPLE